MQNIYFNLSSSFFVTCVESLSNFQELRIFFDDIHEDAIDVVPELGVDVLLVLQSTSDLQK